ncbi:MAG: hypothetical protein GKR89_25535 [Candidatus Latescibacteria bacterium]|nr:hypothetical protein [Candidatus Latescibacterota bacterium]
MPLARVWGFSSIGLLSLSWLLLATACGPSLQQRMAQFAQAGDFAAVADLHMEALDRDPSNPVHRIGLQVNGQKVLDGLTGQAAALGWQGNLEAAIRGYQAALHYRERVAGYGVSLVLGTEHETSFARLKKERVQELYRRGLMLARSRAYRQAEEVFLELRRLQPDYADIDRQIDAAVYGQGLAEYDGEAWQAAYYLFDRVGSYKNAREYMRECLENGRVDIAVLPVVYQGGYWAGRAAPMLEVELLQDLSAREDPFVRYIDPGQRDWAGSQSVHYSARVEILAVERPRAQETTRSVRAWLWDGSLEEDTTAVGRKRAVGAQETTYRQVQGRKEVRLVIGLQLTQVGSGAVVLAQQLDWSSAATIQYGLYEGNSRQLYRNKPGEKRSIWRGGGYADRVDQEQFKEWRRQYGEDGELLARCIAPLAGRAGGLLAGLDSKD